MHIGYLVQTGNPTLSGGVPGATLSRARHMRRQGFEVSIFCRGSEGFEAVCEIEGVWTRPVRAKHGWRMGYWMSRNFNPAYPRALAQAVRARHTELPFDVLDVQDAAAGLGIWDWARESGIATVFTVHGTVLHDAGHSWSYRTYHGRAERIALRKADARVAVSRSIAAPFTALGARVESFRTVHNAVPEEFFHVRAERSEPAAEAPLRALYVGRFGEGKRLDVAIQAMALLAPNVATLHLVGDGPAKTSLVALADELRVGGRVTFSNGFVTNRAVLLTAYRDRHLFVWPSEFESFGLGLAEAMAAGLACVAADTPVTREVAGDAIAPFAPGSPKELADQILRCAQDRDYLSSLQAKGASRAEEFRAESCYGKLRDLYDELTSCRNEAHP